MARYITAIGGGDVANGGTFSIDRRFVAQADVARPRLLFIPTASNDSEDYVASIESAYRDRLGCEVDVLRLLSDDAWHPRIAAKLDAADLVYVGGGNTKAMLEKWRELGVDVALKRRIAEGLPVGGASAGAICWFRVGNSDWPQYEQIPNVTTAPLACLGIVDIALCPHIGGEPFRIGDFKKMMETESGPGIGLDNNCAIQICNDDYRIIASQGSCSAHLVYRGVDGVVHEQIDPHDDFRPLSELHARIGG